MIQTGFESRIKIQNIVDSQLPEFILDESPKTSEFLKQYYISQEYQGGTVDIAENLDQYLKLDNLTPEVIVGATTLSSSISSTATTIEVSTTKGFPQTYGLLKIDNEIITYTGITTNTFTGCIRGFSGVTNYHEDLNRGELVFSTSDSANHVGLTTVTNLSSLFLKEFYNKIKYSLTPELENKTFISNLNVGNFIKEAKSLYQTKGTEESFRILFNVLFGETPKVIDLENFLIKPSSAEYIRRKVVVAEAISGDPLNLSGQTIFKNTDSNTSAAISEVEVISRKGKVYYKLLLFIGFDDVYSTITGNFQITGNTKNIDYVSVGSSVITVDSTIGFPKSGTIYSEENTITYTDKSINQFFGCSGVTSGISTSSNIYSNETYYGYENGDTTKKVELRLTGVLSDYEPLVTDSPIKVGEKIKVKHLGEIIKNPSSNSSYKEVFANSWIYNTSSRYQVKSLDSSTQITLKSNIDKSSLKVGDRIDILLKGTESIIASNLLVVSINETTNQITIGSTFSGSSGLEYDIRRKLKNANSSTIALEFNTITSDVQNVYNENNEYMYVASNSLPSYDITKSLFSYDASNVTDYTEDDKLYSTITFATSISFRTGDEVYYKPSGSPISGLNEGKYYIEVISNTEIKLYYSRQVIGTSNYLKFGSLTSGSHNFTLNSQKEKILSPQKILRKFPLSVNNNSTKFDETIPGPVGLLINGVEILNYKSNDKIYYGPLKKVNVLDGGVGYDVINPPLLSVSSGSALVQPVVSGSVERVFVDPQDFDIDVIVSVAMSGGNGKGASFEPVIEQKRREIEFDARQVQFGGGVDTTYETITFLQNHNLSNGQEIIYYSENNSPLGITTLFGGLDIDSGNTLKNYSRYYSKYINDTTIQLYQTFSDYNSGINTVGFTTIGTSGIHKFITNVRNTLKEIKVISGGDGYTNRKLRVSPVGVSTTKNTISFENHGFNDGELVTYSTTNTSISGLSTLNQYYITKVDSDSFKLSDAGVGGTSISNYERKKYVSLGSTGSGYHIFNYPNISLNVNYTIVGLGTTQTKGVINATPIVRGKIVDTYVYEQGSDYGSTILNYHKKPSITIKNGKNAQLKPIIIDGKINRVIVQYGGEEFYSTPDIIVNGDGVGAILKPVISNNKISGIVVVNSGYDYTEENTSIAVKSAGKNVSLSPEVRPLTINNNVFYKSVGVSTLTHEIIESSNHNLQYFVCGYSGDLQTEFSDTNDSVHSPIIGWAYDGNPIYGSYGYSDPEDTNSIKRVISGYDVNINNITNRPSGFDLGFFIEDYNFTNSGDLDENNGRFCVTPEFPNGTYAYFATSVLNDQAEIVGSFPYFIGNNYYSKYESINQYLNQDFDFNNSNLIRNTFPYKVNQQYADNDFIIESNEVIDQITIVESVTKDSISDFEIINSGDNYKIRDRVEFNESESGGSGLIVEVSELEGKEIINLQNSTTSYNDVIFTWENRNQIKATLRSGFNLNNLDYVTVSGFSTTLSSLNGVHQIGITSYSSVLTKAIPASAGIVTDIYLSNLPKNILVGSSIKIESETLTILNVFNTQNVLRVLSTGVAHTATTPVYFTVNNFIIDKTVDYFDSKVNDLVYFNPNQSIGVGTTSGIGIAVTNNVGIQTNNIISIPSQSIYLPNHPFNTNQLVTLVKPSSSSAISVANTSTSSVFNLPLTGDTQDVYIIRKSADHIGIVTQIGLTTTTNGLFFITNGSNNYEYYFQSKYDEVKGNVLKNSTTVSVSTSHGLTSGDIINLTVKPNLSVGIGTSSTIRIERDLNTNYILLNPIGFSSAGINTENSTINITSHNLNTGDKVKYSADLVASGLTTEFYFVYKVDNNKIKLSQTYNDCVENIPPVTISIGSTGGASHKLSLVNPQFTSIRNNNIVFNLSDSSLLNYKFKIFLDSNLSKEFVSTGSTETFSVSGVGTIGVSTNASVTINYSDELPTELFYGLEKNGIVQNPDKDVKNYCKITFVDSYYNNSYRISGVGTTTFVLSLSNSPEKNSYLNTECELLEYTTNSTSASGGIKKVRAISSGLNYNNLPSFSSVNSDLGTGAYIVSKSDTIGRINEIRILNEGFEYSSDRTLKPQALISKFATIKNSNVIKNVFVTFGGKNYISAPNLIIINTETNELINSGNLIANLNVGSIESVKIDVAPKGLSESIFTLRAVNNTNGVRITKVESSVSGIITCTLTTPLSGFSVEPFSVGDKIFVEGIEKYGDSGDGFNSENYDYQFFTISNYNTANPRKLEYNLSGLTTNPGIAKTLDNLYGTVINYKNYPQFEVEQEFSTFIVGEKLKVKDQLGFSIQDLQITEVNQNYIKISGLYNLEKNQIVMGSQSGSIATINSINETTGQFIVDFSYTKRVGWEDNIGKLNDDMQVIPNNDYYQNLSYSIKSNQVWEDIVSPVNSLLHPSGLKNFSDTQILQNTSVGIGSTSELNIFYDIINENRVDTINNFDLVQDVDVSNNSSKFLKFKNKKLSDYLECKTNRVLQIDDISSEFSTPDQSDVFELTYDGTPIFMKVFDPSASNSGVGTVNLTTGEFTITNHFFNDGEELIYRPNSTTGISSAVGIGSTLNYVGVVTDLLPDRVFVIKTNNNKFKLSTRKEYASLGIAVTFTSVGIGDAHELEMVKKNEKTIISINNIVQSPISYSLLDYTINNDGQISTASTIFGLSGISSILIGDLLKIDNEYMKITNVGLGTTYSGPISFAGTFPLVQVQRAFVGSSLTTHNNSGIASVYRGSYNIVKSDIYFTEPPAGNININNTTFVTSVSAAGTIGITSSLITGINTLGIEVGQTVKVIGGLIASGTLVSTIGIGTIYINQLSLNSVGIDTYVFDFGYYADYNLPEFNSSFDGRVFLRKDYTTNQIYDNISEKFTGIGQTYALTVGGANTVGLGTSGGSGIVFINGVYQTPTTQNNPNNNFSIIESVGVSSIVFSGVTTAGGVFISQSDLNQNQLPRGGVIVSLGSSGGLGYAPLVGASVTAILSGGVINSIGIGTTGNWGSGYRNPVSVAVTDSTGNGASIAASVGAGGTLSFVVVSGGSGYTNPIINVSPPSYSNLSITGVSRLGIGTTTDCGTGLLINVDVGASSTTGIGSTLFEVTGFNIIRSGYQFKKGDVVKPVGLVTDYNLINPLSEFELTVLDVYTDSFSAIQFGELDYIDSIKNYQDGSRTRFPLYYNSQLISFEKNLEDPDSQLIEFDNLLIIFLNGILQQPGVAYEFDGGTSFSFTEPPKVEDKVDIYFYKGSSQDSEIVNIYETVKPGDIVQVFSNNQYLSNTVTQNERVISKIDSIDVIETNLYNDQGIDEIYYKPVYWTKQKNDLFINGELVSKSRDLFEPQIYPTAKIIKSISSGSNEIFVDNVSLFKYEGNITFDGLIVSGNSDPVSAAVTAIVSAAGTIQSLSINNVGSGYTGSSVTVSISNPKTSIVGFGTSLSVGIGTTATASISIVNGSLSVVTITNPGSGYTSTQPPQVLVPYPKVTYEEITSISGVAGTSGNIIGIGTTVGIGTDLALKFTLSDIYGSTLNLDLVGLQIGYPIYIFNTSVGSGVTSIDTIDANVVGIGTTFLDNIYYVSARDATTGIITCNIHSQSSIVGIATTGNVGKFSWGRFSGFVRSSNPISIAVSGYNVSSGLSTFPTIQRRGYGLRSIGAIKKS